MTLFRTGDIIMVLLMLCTAFWTYETKYEAQKRYQEARILQRDIEAERDAAAVLRARWALAADPERLQRLAAQYHDDLQLDIIMPRQIVKLDAVPQRLPDAIEIAIKDSNTLLAKDNLAKSDLAKGSAAGNLDLAATASISGGSKGGAAGGAAAAGRLAPSETVAAAEGAALAAGAARKIGQTEQRENQGAVPAQSLSGAGQLQSGIGGAGGL